MHPDSLGATGFSYAFEPEPGSGVYADYEIAHHLFLKHLVEIFGTPQNAISADGASAFGHIIVQESEDLGMS
jgi:hypothetical protein